MTTYPNQKIIHINKSKYTNNFLQVGIDEWQTAAKELSPSAFKLYLYLASNADGYDLALSQKAVENAIGIKKTAYHTAVKELSEKGYINTIQGNIEAFNTAAVRKSELCQSNEVKKENLEVRKSELISSQKRTTEFANPNLEVRKSDREIDNIDKQIKIDNINKAPQAAVKEKKRNDNLDEDCLSLMREMSADYEAKKFNKGQEALLIELSNFLNANKNIMSAAALYDEISTTYYIVYSDAAVMV